MNSSHDSPISLTSNDEMSLFDLWQMLYQGWHLILGGLVVGLAVAGAYLATTPGQYEGTLLIKVGQVSEVSSAKEIEVPSVREIEPIHVVIDRLQVPDFKNAVSKSLGWKGDAREQLFRSSLQATNPINMHLKISLRSITPDDTRRAMEATMAELASVHRAMLEAIADKNKRKLTAIVAEIHDVEVLLSRLDQIGKEILPGDHQGIVMWLQTTQDQKNHLRSLRRQESVLSEVLNSKLTVPTAAVEPVVVSSSPVYPKARKAWMLAGIGGLLLGMLMVTLRALVGMKAERVFTRDRVDTDDHQACSPIANGVQK